MSFTGNYNEYFGFATDVDAVVYLMLVNDLIHGLFPEAVTIGEDVSAKKIGVIITLLSLSCIKSLLLHEFALVIVTLCYHFYRLVECQHFAFLFKMVV